MIYDQRDARRLSARHTSRATSARRVWQRKRRVMYNVYMHELKYELRRVLCTRLCFTCTMETHLVASAVDGKHAIRVARVVATYG
jgi:hypothetical protein